MKIQKHLFFVLTAALSLLLILPPVFAKQAATPAQNTYLNTHLPNCVYIASYAPGYLWQDEISKTINKTLNGVCQIHTFYMDTKSIRMQDRLKKIGQQARDFIEKHQPDIILASDDNAMKYVIQPYYKDSQIPVVFCGINHTGRPYGLPYRNTTGMIEKLPIERIYKFVLSKRQSRSDNTPIELAFLATNTKSEKKKVKYFQEVAQNYPIKVIPFFVNSLSKWHEQYLRLNHNPKYHAIILANARPLKEEWNPELEQIFHQKNNQKTTIAYQKNMFPYSHITFLISATEQGRWTAETAKLILQQGYTTTDLQIVPNQQFELRYNPNMLQTLPPNQRTAVYNYLEKRGSQ